MFLGLFLNCPNVNLKFFNDFRVILELSVNCPENSFDWRCLMLVYKNEFKMTVIYMAAITVLLSCRHKTLWEACPTVYWFIGLLVCPKHISNKEENKHLRCFLGMCVDWGGGVNCGCGLSTHPSAPMIVTTHHLLLFAYRRLSSGATTFLCLVTWWCLMLKEKKIWAYWTDIPSKILHWDSFSN